MTGYRSGASGHGANSEYRLRGIMEADCVFCRSQTRLEESTIDVIDNIDDLPISAKSKAVWNSFRGILFLNQYRGHRQNWREQLVILRNTYIPL